MKTRISRMVSLIVCILVAVSALGGSARAAEPYGWEEKLKAVDGVTNVEKIGELNSQLFTEKYLVTFEQSLDWSNPSKGTFPQRVEVCLREGADYNVLETDGYCLMDAVMGPMGLAEDPSSEAVRLMNANYVHVEHRFFGYSRPEDMSNEGLKYWEFHTAENAAGDYHRIYTALAPLLGKDWIATGVSRGGQMTNVYGYYFPEDMLVYMPYVAPCSEGPEDPRFYPFVYTEIGNAAFGEEKAKELRDLITAFQVELMRNKEALMPAFEEAAQGAVPCREGVDRGVLYDLTVIEFAVQLWQYQLIPFETLQTILDMPEGTEEEKQAKIAAEYQMLSAVQKPSDFSPAIFAWPYYVNAATTYGQYHYDFSFLREALKEEGLEGTLSVTEEMENGLLFNSVFTAEQRAAFTFDPSFRDALVESIRTTPAKHLMIYGATDPWISLRIPDTDNPNVRVFIHPVRPHTAVISSMPDEMKAEALAVLQEWIGAQ